MSLMRVLLTKRRPNLLIFSVAERNTKRASRMCWELVSSLFKRLCIITRRILNMKRGTFFDCVNNRKNERYVSNKSGSAVR